MDTELLLEPHVEDPVGFVQHQDQELRSVESHGLLEVLQQSPRSGHLSHV